MITIFLTSGSSWQVPVDWNNSNNSVECLGSGAHGTMSIAGGGGSYAKVSNLSLGPNSSISYHVGIPSSNKDTWFNGGTINSSSVGASGAVGNSGGHTSTSVGDVKFSGGNGTWGGGGAAGPHGNGGNGTSNTGGGADGGWGGAGGNVGVNGTAGTEWGSEVGSGGGGGPGRVTYHEVIGSVFNVSASDGGDGGIYGAGGGIGATGTNPGNSAVTTTSPGAGTQGLIKVTYIPVPAPTISFISPNVGSIVGGTSVTITGLNFTNASQVTFGGVAATNVVVVNDSTITCQTPAHTVGFVTVAITTPPGTGSLSNAFQYIAGVKFRWQFVG